MPKVIKGLFLILIGAFLIGGLFSGASAEDKAMNTYPGEVTLVNKVLETAEITVRIDDKTVVKEKLTSTSAVRIWKYGREIPVEGLDEGDQVMAKYQVAPDGKKTLTEINVITQ